MKHKIVAAFVFLLTFTTGFAQNFGHLTIFSEDGDAFFLVLNGEKINTVAQTNLRVEDLNQPYYNAKIIFEDQTKQPISKNNLAIIDADEFYKDVTYKIKRDRNNPSKMKMNFYSMIDVDPGFLPASNVVVLHYGQPQPPVQTSEVITQTTTTTNGGFNGNAGINMNGVGIGINIGINDPSMQVSQTQTVTTNTVQTTSPVYVEEDTRGCANGRGMTNANFNSALQTIKAQKFEDTKLKTAKQIVSSNCLNASQIADICRTFNFEDSKLDFAKSAYINCTEPNNYFKVNNVFTYSSSVDDMTQFVQGR